MQPSNGGAADRRDDRAVPVAVPARARPRHRSGERHCRGRDRRSAVRARGIGRLAARARRLQRRAPAPAARDCQSAVRHRQGDLRSQGARGGGTSSSSDLLVLLDDPQMAGRLERPPHDCRRVPRAERGRRRSAARAEEGRAGAASRRLRAPVVQAPARIWNGRRRRRDARRRRSVRTCRGSSRPSRAQTRDRGLLEILIDEQGRVIGITVRKSMHPLYDSQLMAAARDWRYRPATVGGRAREVPEAHRDRGRETVAAAHSPRRRV